MGSVGYLDTVSKAKTNKKEQKKQRSLSAGRSWELRWRSSGLSWTGAVLCREGAGLAVRMQSKPSLATPGPQDWLLALRPIDGRYSQWDRGSFLPLMYLSLLRPLSLWTQGFFLERAHSASAWETGQCGRSTISCSKKNYHKAKESVPVRSAAPVSAGCK